MILEDVLLQHFSIWDALESSLYMVVVGYYFLIFAYFLLMRYRTSKKLYWLFYSALFIFLAIGRVFFLAYYFYTPEIVGINQAEMAALLMSNYRLATLFTWLGVACVMGVLGILLFPPEASTESKDDDKAAPKGKINLTPNMKIALRIILLAIPIVVGILALALPDTYLMDPDINADYNLGLTLETIQLGSNQYPIGRFILNLVMAPLLLVLIPFIFLYLAVKTFGVLRKSYFLNFVGFFLYAAGRILQGVLESMELRHTEAILPPLLILAALLIIVIANNYEQLR